MQHPDFELVALFTSLIVGCGTVYTFCYFGKLATDSFNNTSHCIYDSKWQHLDNYLKKHLLLMMKISQRQLYYHGFGMLTLNLETFAQVTDSYKIYYIKFVSYIW